MIKHSSFVGSFTKIGQCPTDGLPEYAFIGRSNVGKSSLINALTGRKSLALVSHTPGKTKLLNYFRVNDAWYLVDLPGYGYAKVSKKERFNWDRMIRAYLANRTTLSCVFVLVDSRHTLQRVDLEFINWMGEMQIPMTLVFTKVDKVKAAQRSKTIKAYLKELGTYWEELPPYLITSSVSKEGCDELLAFIDEVNEKILKE